jgi:hypothetical protein
MLFPRVKQTQVKKPEKGRQEARKESDADAAGKLKESVKALYEMSSCVARLSYRPFRARLMACICPTSIRRISNKILRDFKSRVQIREISHAYGL